MKTTVLAATAAAVLFAAPAAAQSTSGSEAWSGAQAGVSINQDAYRGVPSAIAPGLVASGMSCNGSASVGGSGSGWGFSLGITRTDDDCNTRQNAAAVHALTGSVPAAKEVLCDIDQVAGAFRRVGQPCWRDRQQRTSTVAETRTAGYSAGASTDAVRHVTSPRAQ